jgi:DHA3 family macrolide efflux protein-like MFS transporter
VSATSIHKPDRPISRIPLDGSAASAPSLWRSRTFLIVWAGQLISVLGSQMAGFALAVWIYERTHQATGVSLISLSMALPMVLLAPLAGVVADRCDRRLVMLGSEGGAALVVLCLAVLHACGRLGAWQIYLCTALLGGLGIFLYSAYVATVSLLVPKADFARASGLAQSGLAVGQLAAPALAGALVGALGLQPVLWINCCTFLVSAATLATVRFPRPQPTEVGAAARGGVWRQALFSLSYIRTRPGLLALTMLFASTNLCQAMVVVLAMPYLLASSSPAVAGAVFSVAGCGMLAGSLCISAWGGPRRRVLGILGFLALGGACIVVAGAFSSPLIFAVAGFCFLFCMPIVAGCNQAIWQSKVEPDVQGRVFAVRMMIGTSSIPVAYACAGPLADRVFAPLARAGGPLAGPLGRLIGTGPGSGIALLFIVLGTLILLVAAAALLSPSLRHLEQRLPDAIGDASPA